MPAEETDAHVERKDCYTLITITKRLVSVANGVQKSTVENTVVVAKNPFGIFRCEHPIFLAR